MPIGKLSTEELELIDQALFAFPEYKKQGQDIMLARMGAVADKSNKEKLKEAKRESQKTLEELKQKVSLLRSKIKLKQNDIGKGTYDPK